MYCIIDLADLDEIGRDRERERTENYIIILPSLYFICKLIIVCTFALRIHHTLSILYTDNYLISNR